MIVTQPAGDLEKYAEKHRFFCSDQQCNPFAIIEHPRAIDKDRGIVASVSSEKLKTFIEFD
jgi:hypothetical protein